jgi:hypothetical protein
MQEYKSTTDKDPHLWEIAKRRASFKSHFATYLVIVAFFWIIWWFTGAHDGGMGWPWPIWPTAGWGLGVFFHYLGAYVFKESQVDKEYEKLMRERNSK